MSISTYTGIQTALSGLQAAQEALDTTSENIANASTAGYSRQVVNLVPTDPLVVAGGYSQNGAALQVGTGVNAQSITRVRSQYLDAAYRSQNAGSNYASTQSSVLGQAQSVLAEPSTYGISAQLASFWSSWTDLANNPQSQSSRQAVIDAGTTLAGGFNSLDSQLSALGAQVSTQYANLTGAGGQVQTDASQIASLNNQIAQATQAGQSPNTLLDQRDKLIDDLSGLANVTVTNQSNGMVQIGFGDAAAPLVNGTTVTWPQTISAAAGGQLGSLLSLSAPGGQIATYRATLDNAANQLISSVNSLSPTTPFFSGNSASTIAVSATASTVQTSTTTNPGANDVALAIAGLSGGTAEQSYNAFVVQLGSDVKGAQSAAALTGSVLAATGNQRQSVAGVSLDQEMTNLVTYQQAYQASARVMTTMDQALDTLINHTGTVGL